MKRTLLLFLALILLLSLTACGGDTAVSVPAGSAPIPCDESSHQPPAASQNGMFPEDEAAIPEDASQPEASSPSESPGTKSAERGEPPGSTVEKTTEGTQPGNDAELADLWQSLTGCWTAADGRFAYFTYADGVPAYLSGIWESEAIFRRGSGTVSKFAAHGNGKYAITICYPPVTDDNAADVQETRELYVTLELDLGREGIDETIRLTDSDGMTRQYAWGGVSYDDAYDSIHDIQYATFEEMQSLWSELAGCWNSEDGCFVVFDQMDSNTLLFQEGVWDAGGGRGFGTFEKAMTSIGDIPIKFIIYYPAIGEENLVDGPLPELSQPVYLDITDLYTREALHLKIGESGEWKLYESAETDTEDSNQPTW